MSRPNAHYYAGTATTTNADGADDTAMVEIKTVYGTVQAYPANRIADHFALIAGTKTLTRNMGLTRVSVVSDPRPTVDTSREFFFSSATRAKVRFTVD